MGKKSCFNLKNLAAKFLALFIFAICAGAFSQEAKQIDFDKNQSDVAEITELYKKMYNAMISKNLDEMKEIHAENFTLTHMTGVKMNRSEYLAAVKDGTLNYYSAEHDDISVKTAGDKAKIVGKTRVNAAVYGGGKHTWRLEQDMTAQKIGGKWQFTSSVASTY